MELVKQSPKLLSLLPAFLSAYAAQLTSSPVSASSSRTSSSQLSSLSTTNHLNLTECVYCYESFLPSDHIVTLCGNDQHALHFHCWSGYFVAAKRTRKNKCPYKCDS